MVLQGVRGWIAAELPVASKLGNYRLQGFNVQRELLGQEGLHLLLCV